MSYPVQNAYTHNPTAVRSFRDIEYSIIAKTTQNLITAYQNKDSNYIGFIEALYKNEILWSTLVSDVACKENKLPDDLKRGIIYLYNFITDHSKKIRCGSSNIDSLIEINKSILRGLKSEGAH